jgi:hypothetical protein
MRMERPRLLAAAHAAVARVLALTLVQALAKAGCIPADLQTQFGKVRTKGSWY